MIPPLDWMEQISLCLFMAIISRPSITRSSRSQGSTSRYVLIKKKTLSSACSFTFLTYSYSANLEIDSWSWRGHSPLLKEGEADTDGHVVDAERNGVSLLWAVLMEHKVGHDNSLTHIKFVRVLIIKNKYPGHKHKHKHTTKLECGWDKLKRWFQ